MLSKVLSAATIGLEAVSIKVEVDVASRGFPSLTIVGLPNKAIDESKERVRTAIYNSNYEVPGSRIVVNLAPADIPKEGSLFDLPIAIGILTSSGVVDNGFLRNSILVGELSLDGVIHPVPGVLLIAYLAAKKGITNLFVPDGNASGASIIEGVNVYPVKTLLDLILHLNNLKLIKKQPMTDLAKAATIEKYENNFSDIKGQENAKRAMEISSAGFHNVHLKGPPGAGKTMMARAFHSILPIMREEEIIDVTKIYSVVNGGYGSTLITQRPFRAPHHTISRVGLVGGGNKLTPGEITFAHRGVLFLDEFPEFSRSTLEALRQPLEDGVVTISRARGSVTFPARFIFLAASNPCQCGFLGHPKKSCHCSLLQISKYKKRISGPILDRIDIHIDVPPVEEDKLTSEFVSESSEKIRDRVIKSRLHQSKRLIDCNVKTNGEMTVAHIKKYCHMTEDATKLLKLAISRLGLSARGYFKIIKIAQTISDLSSKDKIEKTAIAEALQYRSKEN